MVWHDHPEIREAIGTVSENDFSAHIVCICGGRFKFIGDSYPGCPDFTCDNCGQLVDVKSSPQAQYTGNLSVSVIPWSHYPDDLILATKIDGEWIGEYKRNIQLVSKDNTPMHQSVHPTLKNTRFHLISWAKFKSLKSMGYGER